MDDTVSKWLYDNWYSVYFNHEHMLYACALARFINKPESLGRITKLVFNESPTPGFQPIKSVLRKIKESGATVFNGAYMVRGNDGIDKIECVVDHYVKPLKSIIKHIDTDSMEYTHGVIQSSYGMGSFMAGQVVADLRWAIAGRWADRNDWAPIGPGSNRGMARLYQESFYPMYSQQEFLGRLEWLIEELQNRIPFSDRLEAHDYQNCLCEFDKYERTLFDGRKPKQLFRSLK
jgi:hypothetical protein